MKKKLIPYNLQFFAEEPPAEEPPAEEPPAEDPPAEEIDTQAFADLISEKDKQIQQLQKDVAELKKSNAQLLVRVSAGTKTEEFDSSKAILDFCDTRKVK